MAIFRGSEHPRVDELLGETSELELFAHIEGLAGQEAALLAIPAHERTEAQHEHLRKITAELDRAWEKLRERAERRSKGSKDADAPAAS
jgi:hypothetical protein